MNIIYLLSAVSGGSIFGLLIGNAMSASKIAFLRDALDVAETERKATEELLNASLRRDPKTGRLLKAVQ